MIIENTEALKSWLTSCLSRICDADPAALAKYVLALVKKDKPENELREFCSDQLDVFLLKNTKVFVDLLFDALKSKSYLNSATETTPAVDDKSNTGSSDVNAAAKTSPHSTEYTSINETVKNVKKEIESQLKESSNLDHANRSRSSFKSNRRSKSHSRSPPRKSSRHRDRSRSREGDYSHKRLNSDDDDDRFKSHSYPSKKAKLSKPNRNEYFSKPVDDYKRDDKRGFKYSKDRDQLNYGDRNRSRSKSRSRSRSRDRSSSMVRSRSVSRERVEQTDKMPAVKPDTLKQVSDHGDTDYRQKSLSSVAKPQFTNATNYTKKSSNMCQDYEERGYCMRGDLCPFDHGDDPISLNVDPATSKSGDQLVLNQPPLPPLPPLPPPLPPGYIPEPYNPEAPGMNIPPREPPHIPYWAPPPPHLPPPPIIQPPPPGMPSVIFNINEPPPPFHNAKHHRPRDNLIGVPTIGNIDSRLIVMKNRNRNDDKATVESTENLYAPVEKNKPNNFNTVIVDNEDKKKGFDYNRLGPSPKKVSKYHITRSTLEVRKVPKHLNTIANLNNHFSKFGRIVNLQVSFENDPEAALVQFMTHAEANSAYKSTDAVFNNRFIKVFWHNTDKVNKVLSDTSNSNLVQSELKMDKRITTSSDDATQGTEFSKNNVEKSERSVVYATKPSFSRTIFNPASMKKTNVPNPGALVRKPKEEQRKDALQKRLDLHKKKQELLNSQIENQKSILDKLSKCKSDKERELLKKMMQTMNEKVSTLQTEVRKDSEELKTLIRTANPKSPVSKTEAEKELLDAEMDLYNKQHAGDDTADLLSRVLELKQKAKALGLIDNSPLGPSKLMVRRGRGRFMSRGLYSNINNRTLDRRKSLTLVNKEDISKIVLPVSEVVKMDEPDSSFNDSLDLLDDTVLDVEPDDEEEEDSEARSWRR